MSNIELNENGLRNLLESSTGPVGAFVERKARNVAARARSNADNPFRGAGRPWVRTRDLVNGLDARGPFHAPGGAYWHVGSDAKHRGIAYPRLVEKGQPGVHPAYPYLEPALAPDFVRGT